MEGSGGYYCSTSGTVFADKDALTNHYKSDLHRYNLKRKVAGLPPVTREWFEARKEQLASLQAKAAVPSVYICPLTGKTFKTEATYTTHTGTKAFKAAMKKAGLTEPPPPIKKAVSQRAPPEAAQQAQPQDMSQVMAAFKGGARIQSKSDETMEDDDEDDGSGWETDDGDEADDDSMEADEGQAQARPADRSGDDAAVDSSGVDGADGAAMDGSEWEPWDLCRCLFDNHVSPSFQANLEYMYKKFGFFFPDAPYLTDPEGLLRYLGAKIQYGHVPLFTAGDDPNVKRFRSVHAVQRHMVDTNKCRMLYDGNEDEYEEFYEYPDDDESGAIILLDDEDAASSAAQELHLSTPGSSQVRILGHRGFWQLYRQRHKPSDTRPGVAANQVLLTYRNFGIKEVSKEEISKRVQRLRQERKRQYHDLKVGIKNDKIFKLPKNVTY